MTTQLAKHIHGHDRPHNLSSFIVPSSKHHSSSFIITHGLPASTVSASAVLCCATLFVAEPAIVEVIPTPGMAASPSPEPQPSPRLVPRPTRPMEPEEPAEAAAGPSPEPMEDIPAEVEPPVLSSPRPKGTVVLSSELQPSPSPSPSPAPSPVPDIKIRILPDSPSPAPEDERLVSIIPTVGLPSPSPAVTQESAAKQQGAAAAAAAAAAAGAAVASINSTGVVDVPADVTVLQPGQSPAGAAAAEVPRATQGPQQATNLVLGYEGKCCLQAQHRVMGMANGTVHAQHCTALHCTDSS